MNWRGCIFDLSLFVFPSVHLWALLDKGNWANTSCDAGCCSISGLSWSDQSVPKTSLSVALWKSASTSPDEQQAEFTSPEHNCQDTSVKARTAAGRVQTSMSEAIQLELKVWNNISFLPCFKSDFHRSRTSGNNTENVHLKYLHLFVYHFCEQWSYWKLYLGRTYTTVT